MTIYKPIFTDGDILIGDDNKVYKLVYDCKLDACERCTFWKTKTSMISCLGYLRKIFKTEIQKRSPYRDSETCFCEDLIGNNHDTGAHFIDITSTSRLSQWKDFIK